MMRFVSFALCIAALAALTACAPSVTDANVTGDVNECTVAIVCSDGSCGGVEYEITCTLNANETYDCVCTSNGTAGETFQEAEVCVQDGDDFPSLTPEDISVHAVDDCKFPLTPGAE